MKKTGLTLTTIAALLAGVFTFTACDKDDAKIRVGSYNILHGAQVDLQMSIIANDIVSHNLDIVGLQEIDQKTDRVKKLDTMKALSEASGYPHYAFTRAIDFQGGEYGTGILSRYPIVSFEVIPLDSENYEQRALGHAVIEIHGKRVDFFNTHLSYENDEVRAKQFETLRDRTAGCKTFLLTGDFNTSDTNEFKVISNSSLVNRNTYSTFPESQSSIDNIVYSSDFTLADSGMGPAGHSDHNMLWAELKWTPVRKNEKR